MKEIGSEFWIEKVGDSLSTEWYAFNKPHQLLYSGRTAIEFVLSDLDDVIESVYFPSYCCDSMLKPFFDRNIKIELYDVIISDNGIEYIIDVNKKVDMFFSMSYFGFSSTNMDSYINEFTRRDVIVVEDITHRFLCEKPFCENAHYAISSLRKWFGIPSGGIVIKIKGNLEDKKLLPAPKTHVGNKLKAMNLKEYYIKAISLNKYNSELEMRKIKNSFLNLYTQFNDSINNNYVGINIDEISKEILRKLNLESTKQIRKLNSQYLIKEISKIGGLKLLVSSFDLEEDCPLFIPIIVDADIRDNLRSHLRKKSIYLPIHWGKPKGIKLDEKQKEIYQSQLSLICDQRYDISDMEIMVDVLKSFFK